MLRHSWAQVVLQFVRVCCSVLQWDMLRCAHAQGVLQHTTLQCGIALQRAAVFCTAMFRVHTYFYKICVYVDCTLHVYTCTYVLLVCISLLFARPTCIYMHIYVYIYTYIYI